MEESMAPHGVKECAHTVEPDLVGRRNGWWCGLATLGGVKHDMGCHKNVSKIK